MNDTNIYQNLKALNISFQFTLAPEPGSQDVVKINIPFASLDLSISWPYINSTSFKKYFPVKRAKNDQYTLGRSFLQDAYLAVDYDHGNFSVHQALYPPQQDQIVPMNYTNISNGGDASTGEKKFPVEAIVGIAIGVCFAGIVVGLLAYRAYWQKRKRDEETRRRNQDIEDRQPRLCEVDGESALIKPGQCYLQGPNELSGVSIERSELTAVNFEPAELGGASINFPAERFSWEDDDRVPPYPHQNIESPVLSGKRPDPLYIEMSPVSPQTRPSSQLVSPATTLGGYRGSGSAQPSPLAQAF